MPRLVTELSQSFPQLLANSSSFVFIAVRLVQNHQGNSELDRCAERLTRSLNAFLFVLKYEEAYIFELIAQILQIIISRRGRLLYLHVIGVEIAKGAEGSR